MTDSHKNQHQIPRLTTLILMFGVSTFLYLGCASSASLLGTATSPSSKARQLKNEARWDDAIEQYYKHMEGRLRDPRRPIEENPYFYYILIGDCHLELSEFTQAHNAYITGYANGVEPEIIAFRVRRLAKWLEDRELYEEAMDLLSFYRHLDELLLDYDIDQLHKKSIAKEERKTATTQEK